MDPLKMNALNAPVTTGSPAITPQTGQPAAANQPSTPFLQVLQQQLEAKSNTSFSKHAVSRVAQRQIDVSEQNMQRLDEGMKLAQQKGLNNALILIDNSAYIVNTAAGKVVTVNADTSSPSVFTNIDGTVII